MATQYLTRDQIEQRLRRELQAQGLRHEDLAERLGKENASYVSEALRSGAIDWLAILAEELDVEIVSTDPRYPVKR